MNKKEEIGTDIRIDVGKNYKGKLELSGNSVQKTRKGTNILNFNVEQDGRVIVNDDGTITLNGTGGFSLKYKEITLKADVTYYQKWELISGSISSNSDNEVFMALDSSAYAKRNNFTSILRKEDTTRVGLWISANASFENAVVRMWANTDQSDFELYGAMPSLDFKSDVKSCGDNIQILKGVEEVTGVTTSGIWNDGTWRIASRGTATRTRIDIADAPNKNIKKGWRFEYTADTGTSDENTDIAQDKVPVKNGEKYTLSCYARCNKGTTTLRLQYGKNPYISNEISMINDGIWRKYSFTFTIGEKSDGSEDGSTNIYFGLRGHLEGKLEICGQKLEQSSVASEYSPYGQGCISEIVANKNRFNLSTMPLKNGLWTSGTNIGLNANGWYVVVPIVGGKKITISKKNSSSKSSLLKLYAATTSDYPANGVKQIDGWQGSSDLTELTITTSVSAKYLFLGLTAGSISEVTDVVKQLAIEDLQVEESTAKTDYIPHAEQLITIPTQQPMRAVGDIRDCFIKKDGKRYERHNIIEFVLNGTENVTYYDAPNQTSSNNSETIYFSIPAANIKFVASDVNLEAFCNMFKNAGSANNIWNPLNANLESFFAYADSIRLRIKKSRLSGYSDDLTATEKATLLKNYLKTLYDNGIPIKVYAIRRDVLDLECTEEQNSRLDKLENIILYEGINHIYCLDEVSPLLRLTYYKIIEDYDMYISSNGRFVVPKYNIDYLVDMASSTLFGMPEAAENSARIAGRDGDMVLATTYQPLSCNIVCYTEDNLTPQEKSDEERKLNRFLNEIKNTFKKIAIENNNIFYEIKYNGLLTATNFPKHIQFSIPLKSSKSYGFAIGKKEIVGNGIVESNTIKECGAIFTINGPAITPIISLNDYSMEFNTNIVEGATLIIDSNKSTVTYTNPSGVKTNQMKYYNHQFPKIQNGVNELKVLSGINNEQQVKVEWYDLTL